MSSRAASIGLAGASPRTHRSSSGEQQPVAAPARKRHLDTAEQAADKRVKVTRACDACKHRKGKCTGTLPCDGCVSRGLQCLYATRYGRGRPPDPTPSSLVSPSGAARPSERLDDQETVVASDPTAASGFADRLQTSTRDTPLPLSRASPDLGAAEIQGQYVDPTSGLAFLHRAWKRLSSHQPRTVDSEGANNGSELHQTQMCAGDKPFEPDPGGPLPIPSVATASELLAFYFDVCIATYRFLHRPTVAAWLDRLQSNKAQGLPLAHGLGEMKAAVVLTILAIGIFHRAMSRGRQDPVHEEFLSLNHSDRLFSEAARLVDTAKGFPNLVSVQARLIQVLYLLHSSRMNQAWYAFGNVFQTIAVLGLHRRTNRARTLASKAATRDYIQSQCQKRTFWSTYILDIYLGVIFGRPRHYHDEDIDQDLPDAVNDEDMTAQGPAARKGHKDCAIEVLICHAKIARIVANISRRIYRDGKARMESLAQRAGDLVGDLARWKSELPPFLGSVNPTSLVPPYRRQATSMKLAYCHAMMHANRPFLLRRMEADRGHSDLVQRRIVDCMAAAREVLEMVDDMASDGTLFHAFWWTHYVAFCSLAIVYVWQIQRNGAGNDNNNETTGGTALAPDLDGLFDLAERCQHHLAEATASNSPSRRYSIILEELRQEAMSYTARGPRQVYAEQTDVKGRDVESGGPHEEGSRLDHHHHDSAPFSMEASQVNGGYLPAHVWDNWQTTDWLDMDSLALGTFSGFELSPQSWFPEQPSNGLFF